MVSVRTDLGDLHDFARNLRVEQVGVIESTNIQGALDQLASGSEGGWTQRTISSGVGLPIEATDVVLNVTTTGSFTAVTIPAANTRGGVPLLLQDKAASWQANNPVFSRTGTDTFDGATSLTGTINYGWIMLRPYDDLSGYKVTGIWQ